MKDNMNKDIILKKIEKNRKDIKKFKVSKIGLFGSFLKKNSKLNSDVDILVTFDEISFNNYINLLRYLKKLLRKKIDLVIESDLKPELNYVKKEAEYVTI